MVRRGRFVAAVAFVAVAVACLRGEVPAQRPQAGRHHAQPGDADVVLAVLGTLAAVFLGLLVIAAIGCADPNRRRAGPRPHTRRIPGGKFGVVALFTLLGTAMLAPVLAGMLARRLATPDGRVDTGADDERDPAGDSATAGRIPDGPAVVADTDIHWSLWTAMIAAFLIVLTVGAFAVRLRARPVRGAESGPETHRAVTPPELLTGAAEQALAGLSEAARGPRQAIIACYTAMETELAGSAAAPRLADTPSEVLGRAAQAGLVRGAGAWRLVELFDEARFSSHSMTERDRATAFSALRELLEELRRYP